VRVLLLRGRGLPAARADRRSPHVVSALRRHEARLRSAEHVAGADERVPPGAVAGAAAQRRRPPALRRWL